MLRMPPPGLSQVSLDNLPSTTTKLSPTDCSLVICRNWPGASPLPPTDLRKRPSLQNTRTRLESLSAITVWVGDIAALAAPNQDPPSGKFGYIAFVVSNAGGSTAGTRSEVWSAQPVQRDAPVANAIVNSRGADHRFIRDHRPTVHHLRARPRVPCFPRQSDSRRSTISRSPEFRGIALSHGPRRTG